MTLFWPLRRVAKSIHFRLGRYLAEDQAGASRPSHAPLAEQIRRSCNKINMGCGYEKLAGYLNVDVDPACSPDLLIVGGDDAMIPRQHFRELLAADVLEHIPRAQTPAALLDWADYLVEGGTLIVQTSSILDVASKLRQFPRYRDQHAWTICLFGNQAHPGDFHHTGFTDVTLKVQLLSAGFRIDRLELKDDWLLRAEATKVENWAAPCAAGIASDIDFFREAYRRAVARDAEEQEIRDSTAALTRGSSRKDVLKAVYASPERLFRVAETNAL